MIGGYQQLPAPATYSKYSASMSRAAKLFFSLIFVVTFVVVFLQMSTGYSHLHQISPWKLGQYTQQQFKAAASASRPTWKTIVRLGSAQPTIGTCTVAHGKHAEGYERALQSHLLHSEFHGYPAFLLDHPILDGLWSKESALLDVVLNELAKPESERLKWLVWFDADTVIMNKLIPLETFVPPKDRPDIHMLYTKDWNGLNNGVFFMDVSNWSLEMLSSIIAYRSFRPLDELPFTEQSAMEKVLQMNKYRDGALEVPPQWFNAYPSDGGEKDVHFDHRPGQLLVHFAGIGDKSKAIGEWLDKLEKDRAVWELPLRETNYQSQIKAFWDEKEKEYKFKQEDEMKKAEDKKKADEQKKIEKAKSDKANLNEAIKEAAEKKKAEDQKNEEEKQRKEAEKKAADERKAQDESKREVWDGVIL